jgi:hypothetical protein
MPIVKSIVGNIPELFKEGKVPNILANITNCQKVMTGLAKELADEFNLITAVDEEFPLPAEYRIGDYSGTRVDAGSILNFYVSMEPGGHFEYSALKSCLKKLSSEAMAAKSYIQLTFPLITAPEYGAKWEYIRKILDTQENLLITVVQHDQGQVPMGKGEADSAS